MTDLKCILTAKEGIAVKTMLVFAVVMLICGVAYGLRARSILFIGDSTVTNMEREGRSLLERLRKEEHFYVRIAARNEAEDCVKGGSIAAIRESIPCLYDQILCADRVIILAGSHDSLIGTGKTAEDRQALIDALRDELPTDTKLIYFDTTELLSEEWADVRHDWAHLTESGYERLFVKLGLLPAEGPD